MSELMVSWRCRDDEELRARGDQMQQAVQTAIDMAFTSNVATGMCSHVHGTLNVMRSCVGRGIAVYSQTSQTYSICL